MSRKKKSRLNKNKNKKAQKKAKGKKRVRGNIHTIRKKERRKRQHTDQKKKKKNNNNNALDKLMCKCTWAFSSFTYQTLSLSFLPILERKLFS